jgi:tight adherence protein B
MVMPSLSPYLLILTFIISTILFKLVHSALFEKGKYEKRLQQYIDFNDLGDAQKKKEVSEKRQNSSLTKVGKVIETVLNLSENEQLLIQSGVSLTLGEVFIGRIMLAIIGVAIGYFYDFFILFTMMCGVFGFYLPIMYIKQRRKKRLQLTSSQLGEALGTMANALRAGFSFMQALKMVAEEIKEPLGPELLKALQEINYGITVEDAFQNLIKRLPDKELELVLNTIIIQRTTGGNLASLMETMQETIFGRARVQDEVKALTAQGKLSSMIITILPIALAIYIRLVNPEYFLMLFSHPIGWAMVIWGSISIILGWIFIKKIVHIEV